MLWYGACIHLSLTVYEKKDLYVSPLKWKVPKGTFEGADLAKPCP